MTDWDKKARELHSNISGRLCASGGGDCVDMMARCYCLDEQRSIVEALRAAEAEGRKASEAEYDEVKSRIDHYVQHLTIKTAERDEARAEVARLQAALAPKPDPSISAKHWRHSVERERHMQLWDSMRSYIAKGGGGSWPRDAFEALLDAYDEDLARLKGDLAAFAPWTDASGNTWFALPAKSHADLNADISAARAAALKEAEEKVREVAKEYLTDGDWDANTIMAIEINIADAIAALAKERPPAAETPGHNFPFDMGAKVESVWRDICELPDRTSPADHPEMVLLSFEEFCGAVGEVLAEVATLPAPDAILDVTREFHHEVADFIAVLEARRFFGTTQHFSPEKFAELQRKVESVPPSLDPRDAEITRLREVLRPFSELLRKDFPDIDRYSDDSSALVPVNVGIVRPALAALGEGPLASEVG